jgi:hypothetical protein
MNGNNPDVKCNVAPPGTFPSTPLSQYPNSGEMTKFAFEPTQSPTIFYLHPSLENSNSSWDLIAKNKIGDNTLCQNTLTFDCFTNVIALPMPTVILTGLNALANFLPGVPVTEDSSIEPVKWRLII